METPLTPEEKYDKVLELIESEKDKLSDRARFVDSTKELVLINIRKKVSDGVKLSLITIPADTTIHVRLHKSTNHCKIYFFDDSVNAVRSVTISWKTANGMFPEKFGYADDEQISEAIFDGACPSVNLNYDENLEPDGYDPEGWPSILLAYGYCRKPHSGTPADR